MQKQPTRRGGACPAEELALLCEQLAIALSGGIPLHDAMDTLTDSLRDDAAAAVLSGVQERLLESGSLADALEGEPAFPQYMTAMVRIGERVGKLDEVCAKLAAYYRWEASVRQTVKGAVLYPTVLVLMMAVVIAVLLVSVLPVFQQVFAGLGMELGSAGAAAAGMTIGRVALVFTGLVLLALAATLLLLRTRARTRVMRLVSRLVPALGRANVRYSDGRLASVISMMLSAGYQLEAAMELAPAVISDEDYRAQLLRCSEALAEGTGVADALTGAGLFSTMHQKLIRFGAAAGKLDEVMARVSEDCRTEADDAVSRLISLIEPTLVAVLSLVIGGILLAVMLPLLSLLSAMG